MPNNPSANRAARPAIRPEPVPVGLFLAARSLPRRAEFARPGVPNWHGLHPTDLAYLIRRYTRAGSVVLDLDEHPTVTAATRYLRRTPAKLVTWGRTARLRLIPPPARAHRPRRGVSRRMPGADLILVTLPRAGVDSLDLHGLTHAMTGWRRLLRPGGHLLAALNVRDPQPGMIGHRATVIAAASVAGLIYHQHIPVLLTTLPEHEPRTEPEQPNEDNAAGRLLTGRHLPAFRDVLAFTATTTHEEVHRG